MNYNYTCCDHGRVGRPDPPIRGAGCGSWSVQLGPDARNTFLLLDDKEVIHQPLFPKVWNASWAWMPFKPRLGRLSVWCKSVGADTP